MQDSSSEYDIRLTPRGPNNCEWKLFPKAGGPAKAQGVAKDTFEAQRAAEKAIARLSKKK